MPTVLFVNACIRGRDSRTLALGERLLTRIKEANGKDMAFRIEEIRLSTENLLPLNYERLQRREELLASGQYQDTMFDYANAVACADMIVIAAPCWNMSFPAVLQIFFEAASVEGITYAREADGTARGLCRAQDMYYVTTDGYGSARSPGADYIDALRRLYGIKELHVFSTGGLDMEGADVRALLEGTILKRRGT